MLGNLRFRCPVTCFQAIPYWNPCQQLSVNFVPRVQRFDKTSWSTHFPIIHELSSHFHLRVNHRYRAIRLLHAQSNLSPRSSHYQLLLVILLNILSSSSVTFTTCAYSRKKGHACFQEKGKKRAKNGKIFENLGKNLQDLKTFWKRAASCVRLSHA